MVESELNLVEHRLVRRLPLMTGALALIAVLGSTVSQSFADTTTRPAECGDGAQGAAAGLGDNGTGTGAGDMRPTGTLPVGGIDYDELDDPRKDGWETEDFNNRAGDQLKALGKLLEHPGEIDADSLAPLAGAKFASRPLLPSKLHPVYQSDQLLVERSDPGTTLVASESFGGVSGFASALRALVAPFAGATEMHSKFKLFRVSRTAEYVTTQQYFSLSGQTPQGMVEQNASWQIRWSVASAVGRPQIEGIAVTEFEQVTRSGGSWFVDCTESLLGANACYQPQLLQGYGHWLERIPHGVYLESFGSPGLAVGDANGDGLDDLYLCQERGLPNRLFLQQSDGTAQEVAADWGVDWLESSRSALMLDLDNDGDQDLVVAVMGGVVLASNEGGEHFQYRTLIPTTEDLMSLSSVDFDNDGDLDLYACGYYADKTLDSYGDAGGAAMPTGGAGFVMHDANTGGQSHLLRNDISTSPDAWQFEDVTQSVGMDVNNRRFSFGASWEDYDNDGDQDLYVANDFGRDNLYRNDGGKFVDVSESANIEDAGTGMGITWGDFDRDGLMDAYVSNMFSAAGNRITFQDKFKAQAAPEIKQRIQRLARGNTLLKNAGDGKFLDISSTSGAEMGRWSWASLFSDLNNDGWEDLIVANGYITADDSGDL